MNNELSAPIEFVNSEDRICTDDNSSFVIRILKGSIRGHFEIKPSDISKYRFEDVYANLCNFLFRSEDGRCFQYSAVLHPLFLWTESVRQPLAAIEKFEPDYECKCYVDHRENYTVTLDTGRRVHGFFKYTPIKFGFAFHEGRVVMRVEIWVINRDDQDEEARWETFFAKVPVEQFLSVCPTKQARGVLAVSLISVVDPGPTLPTCPIVVEI